MKEYLSITEVCSYLSVSKSFVYKLSSNNTIPKYCPMGKLVYFKKSDIDSWLENSRIPPNEELKSKADMFSYNYSKK